MKREYTETEIITQVTTFYKGTLFLEKAIKLFEFEYGFLPEIVDPTLLINEDFIDNQNYPDFVTIEALSYMKELQESGVVNMFMSTPYIQNALFLSKSEAKEVLMIYIQDYTKIYFPENLL